MTRDIREERLNAVADQLDALLDYANATTGAGDTRIGDAVRTLADGYRQGGEQRAFFTPVTSIPAGRAFSIPTDYNKCIIIMQLVSTSNLYSGFGYNGGTQNQTTVQWTTDGTGITMISVDNVNMRVNSFGIWSATDTSGRTVPNKSLTTRARNIQPHWINSTTPVTGGYWTVIIEE